jgi:hypothetical protein
MFRLRADMHGGNAERDLDVLDAPGNWTPLERAYLLLSTGRFDRSIVARLVRAGNRPGLGGERRLLSLAYSETARTWNHG